METDNRVEAMLKILCEINNRLSDIAITLQVLGCLSSELNEEDRHIYLDKLKELSSSQKEKYAILSTNYSASL